MVERQGQRAHLAHRQLAVDHPRSVLDLTEREDRGRKKFDYFATPPIQQYALIEQDERRIDLYTRAGAEWTNEIIAGDAVLKLSSIGVEVSLDAIYEDPELDATRPREGEPQAPAL